MCKSRRKEKKINKKKKKKKMSHQIHQKQVSLQNKAITKTIPMILKKIDIRAQKKPHMTLQCSDFPHVLACMLHVLVDSRTHSI